MLIPKLCGRILRKNTGKCQFDSIEILNLKMFLKKKKWLKFPNMFLYMRKK